MEEQANEKIPDKFRRKTFFRTVGSICSIILGPEKRDHAGLKKKKIYETKSMGTICGPRLDST